MTIEEFITETENYYGEYPENRKYIRDAIALYLRGFKEHKLPELLQMVWRNHNANFGAPDIATIEKAYDHAIEMGKCGDLRKMRESTGYETPDLPTKEELEETQRMIEEAGYSSLSEMLNDQIKKKREEL